MEAAREAANTRSQDDQVPVQAHVAAKAVGRWYCREGGRLCCWDGEDDEVRLQGYT